VWRLVGLMVCVCSLGCDGQCTSSCDGDTVHICGNNEGEPFESFEQCLGERAHCVDVAEPGIEPFCAAEVNRREVCAPNLAYACDGRERVHCWYGGFALDVEDCGAPDLCNAVGCLLHPGIDAGCAAIVGKPVDGYAAYCNGMTRIDCRGDYAVGASDCESGTQCAESTTQAACVLGVDARCNKTGGTNYPVCDGMNLLQCFEGYLLSEAPCGENRTCVNGLSGPSCE
jgi:hypothetical protein